MLFINFLFEENLVHRTVFKEKAALNNETAFRFLVSHLVKPSVICDNWVFSNQPKLGTCKNLFKVAYFYWIFEGRAKVCRLPSCKLLSLASHPRKYLCPGGSRRNPGDRVSAFIDALI
uniref:Uncharacterized protein n=1 Tax=Micrurus spixii TaxID=129469 RepID=A0A2D4MC00_9SAUR